VTVAEIAEAGAIVVKFDQGRPRFLLTTAKNNPNHWLFPKGHIEIGETGARTAIREAREETGVEATAHAYVGASKFCYKGDTIRVDFYLLEYSRSVEPGEGRDLLWCTYDEALALLAFEDVREILRNSEPIAEKLRKEA
jgi:8-oxo-dGTP pyrophosphatase MutT (NUDIX family)